MIDLSDGPIVMGILNTTPDSFSDGGTLRNEEEVLAKTDSFIKAGAAVIDVGGESTRPGGERVAVELEISRAVPVIALIKKRFDVPVSIDTSKAAVARAAVEAGADIVNDISGGTFEPEILDVISESNAGCVLMHLRGDFETMHEKTIEGDPAKAVVSDLRRVVEKAVEAGIDKSRICLDVGIGFGKTVEQNLSLLWSLDGISDCFPGITTLVGVSRKSFLGKITGEDDPVKRVPATCVANTVALCKGIDVIRVHDVEAGVQTVRLVRAFKGAQ